MLTVSIGQIFVSLRSNELNSLLYAEALAKSAKLANEANNNAQTNHESETDAMEAEMGLAAAADADHEQVMIPFTKSS